MARNRIIKDSFWSNEKINRVSFEAQLLFIGTWNFADDYGVLLLSTRSILGNVFPLRKEVTEKHICKWLQELITVGLLTILEHNSQNYLWIVGWEEHQRVPNKSKRRWLKADTQESLIRVSLETKFEWLMVNGEWLMVNDERRGTGEDEDGASEQSEKPKGKTEITFSDEQGFQGVTQDMLDSWATTYPACDIPRQLRAMTEWLIANPKKKPKSSYRRFIVGWLSRSQDKGGDLRAGRSTGQPQYNPNSQPKEKKSKREYSQKAFERRAVCTGQALAEMTEPIDEDMYAGLRAQLKHNLLAAGKDQAWLDAQLREGATT